MFKTIVRVVTIILIFLAVLWFAGMTWYSFKNNIELKNPLDVFHIHVPEIVEPGIDVPELEEPNINIPDINTPDINIPDMDAPEVPEITEPETPEVKEPEVPEISNSINFPKLDKEDIDTLISKIRVSSDDKKEGYVRDDFEKPTKYFYIGSTRYTRNKYAWHISEWLNTEEPFSYTCPYTEMEITDISQLDFEHLVPLSYLYKYSDVEWTKEQMNTYAYDQRIGMDVLNKANRSHSDKGPSEWLPEKNIEDYCFTWLVIAYEYDIALRKIDIDVCKLELYNAISSGEEITLINPFIEDCPEYELQQEWVNDIRELLGGAV